MRNLERLTVGDTYDPDRSLFLVGLQDEFSTVVQGLAQHPELRGTFVVDEQQRLLGVITRNDLLDWARAKLGTSLHAPWKGTEKTLRLASLINASTVSEVVHADSIRAAVSLDNSLAHALKLMVEMELIVLPVVDVDRRVIGEVRLSNILARALEAGDENGSSV